MVDGVVADDVDQGRRGSTTVVKVGDPVAETRSEVQQSRGRDTLHTPEAICGTGTDAFEETQHCPGLRHGVDGLHEVHLRGAGVGETGVHSVREQGADDALCTVHVSVRE